MREYLYFGVAIATEIMGTMALKPAAGFTNPVPTLVVVVGYLTSFYFMSLTLQFLPVGMVYATWSGFGIIAVTVLGVVIYNEPVDAVGIAGLVLLLLGIVLLNAVSEMNPNL